MRTAPRSRAWIPFLALTVAVGCGGRTGNDGFGEGANDSGLGGFTGSPGGYSGSVGYAGYSGSYVGAGGSFGGYAGSFGGSVSVGGAIGCGPCPPSGSCGPGQQQVSLPGSCCPTCQQCPPIACPISSCGPGQQLATTPGQCCPVCTTVCFGGVRCPDPMCPPGSTQTTPPGQCCPVCVSPKQCAGVSCPPPPPSCLGGNYVVLPGQCCPSCVPISIDASVGPCDQAGYAQLLQKEMAAFDALSCTNATDCMVGLKPNACSSGCGTAANTKSWPTLNDQLNQIASAICSGCPPIRGGACGLYEAACVNGQCQSVTGSLPPPP